MCFSELKIATAIFTYNRCSHTNRVIKSLKENDILPEKLFVFQDGIKQDANIDEWNEVNKIINEIDWCQTEIIISSTNRGLSVSIISGINYILERYDAVIVLEDDCVVHPGFLNYMTNSLRKYQSYKQVYCINGYSWPTIVSENRADAYFAGRAGSWGWATWKDRWREYKEDYKILSRIKKDEYSRHEFHIWGRDLESYLYGNIEGTCNSWAVFWALLIIEKHGFCLTPYESLVENIGFDGTGVHCGTEELKTKLRDKNNRNDLLLPDNIVFPDNYEKAYRNVFSWTSQEEKLSCYNKILYQWIVLLIGGQKFDDYFIKRNISKIAIWGKGQICELLLRQLSEEINVVFIIETKPVENYFSGIPVVDPDGVTDEVQLIVVLPVYDFEAIKDSVREKLTCQIIALDNLIQTCGGDH